MAKTFFGHPIKDEVTAYKEGNIRRLFIRLSKFQRKLQVDCNRFKQKVRS